MGLEIEVEPTGGKLSHLRIYDDGVCIGEYERSQERDIDRKKDEIRQAAELLLNIYRTHGPFQVRWDGSRWVKSIRVDGTEVGQVPREYWRKPSWE